MNTVGECIPAEEAEVEPQEMIMMDHLKMSEEEGLLQVMEKDHGIPHTIQRVSLILLVRYPPSNGTPL